MSTAARCVRWLDEHPLRVRDVSYSTVCAGTMFSRFTEAEDDPEVQRQQR